MLFVNYISRKLGVRGNDGCKNCNCCSVVILPLFSNRNTKVLRGNVFSFKTTFPSRLCDSIKPFLQLLACVLKQKHLVSHHSYSGTLRENLFSLWCPGWRHVYALASYSLSHSVRLFFFFPAGLTVELIELLVIFASPALSCCSSTIEGSHKCWLNIGIKDYSVLYRGFHVN